MTNNDLLDIRDAADDRQVRLEGWFTAAGFTLMLAVVAAAAAGLFGKGGPAAESRADAPGLTVRFDRSLHRDADTWIEVTATPAGSAAAVRLSMDRAYFKAVRLKSVLPVPTAVTDDDGRLIFAFRTVAPGRPLTARFYLAPQEAGRARLMVSADNGGSVSAAQFVFP